MYILELMKKNSENYEIIAEPGESFKKKDEILKKKGKILWSCF